MALTRSVVAQEAPAALCEGVDIEFLAPDHPVETRGAAAAIAMAVKNLIANAVRHGGTADPIVVEVVEPAAIRVIDRGRGIPPEKREDLLKPFVRGNTDREGVGLGLAIVAQAVTLHDGVINIIDTPGGGATFELLFPPACPGGC